MMRTRTIEVNTRFDALACVARGLLNFIYCNKLQQDSNKIGGHYEQRQRT